MFCNGLKESHEKCVELKGLDSEAMSVLLEYTYTSRAHLTHSNVQRILEAASQFQVKLSYNSLLCSHAEFIHFRRIISNSGTFIIGNTQKNKRTARRHLECNHKI